MTAINIEHDAIEIYIQSEVPYNILNHLVATLVQYIADGKRQ